MSFQKHLSHNVVVAGYYFSITDKGDWKLLAGTKTLQIGKLTSFSANTWHRLKIAFQSTMITAYVDSAKIVSATDRTFSYGWAALGSGYNYAQVILIGACIPTNLIM
jgi:hypothetical protein